MALLRTTHVTPNDDQAEQLQHANPGYTVEVKPSRESNSVPATLPGFVRGIRELQTKWLGLRNASPRITFEIRRATPGQLQLQFTVPTKRLERKLRTHLSNEIPGVEFASGASGLPVTSEDSVGGGLLTNGRQDWYPLQTEFDKPPLNSVVGALHRHAMQDTRIIIQFLFRPVIGHPIGNRWWKRRAYQRIGYLRKEKEKLWGSRNPTPRERSQADAVERKAGTNRFHLTIRFLIIGAGEYTASRVKELAGAFNVFENPDTGQYLNAVTVKTLRSSQILDFAQTVAQRRFGGWTRKFQVSVEELAALLALPDRQQDNIHYSQP